MLIKLSEKLREAVGISGQLGPKFAKDGSTRGRPESGINAAVRELGITPKEGQRAVKIAGLAPEAKAEARTLGLDDNQSALLKAAKVPSKEAQIRALHEEAARKAAGQDAAGASNARLEAAENAVERLSPAELKIFAGWFAAFRARRAGQGQGTAAPNSARRRISL